MYIKHIDITNLRIIQQGSLEPSPNVNLITGDNGAGKTSILEAIYLLGRGKSFRHAHSGPFIKNGFSHSMVIADLVNEDDKSSRLGVERARNSTRVKSDGMDVLRRSELLKLLPLQIITPSSHELIEKGPDTRRGFLDYGMFHVEHGYLDQLSEYTRALKQRNAALRQAQIDVARSYNPILSELGAGIHQHRTAYLIHLTEKLEMTLEALNANFPIKLSISPGWDTRASLEEEFTRLESTDIRRGHTTVGVHRADLLIRTGGISAARHLSRGQQKILVYALKIAQSRVYKDATSMQPILLVDDLGAELDLQHLNKVMQLFEELGLQLFITMVSGDRLENRFESRMFHVEHGEISQCNRQ